VDVDGF